jgi:hypothetical protein
VNLGLPLFFFRQPEGQATLASYFIAATIIVPLHRRLGWVRLLAVAHAPWLVLLPWLALRLVHTDPTGNLRLFILTVLAVDGVSLLIDFVDLGRYVAGDRAPLVGREAEEGRAGEDAGNRSGSPA